MNTLIREIISIPKSILFNLMVFDFKTGFTLPIMISYDTKVKWKSLKKGCIILKTKNTGIFGIKIGVGNGSEGIYPCKLSGYLALNSGSKLMFGGKANFARGTKIRCDGGGIINWGDGFYCNENCFFATNTKLEFGTNCLLGWNVHLRDSDGHQIIDCDNNTAINKNGSVIIGNHVWIGANATILKNVHISDNCVVAYGSIIARSFNETNVIIGNTPGKILRRNINWEK